MGEYKTKTKQKKKKNQNYAISRTEHLRERANRTRDASTLSASVLRQGSSSGFVKPVNHEVLYRKKIWGGGACKTKMGRKVISLKVKLCND